MPDGSEFVVYLEQRKVVVNWLLLRAVCFVTLN